MIDPSNPFNHSCVQDDMGVTPTLFGFGGNAIDGFQCLHFNGDWSCVWQARR